MIFSMLGVLKAFLAYDIFNLQWVYWDVIPLLVEEHLYTYFIMYHKYIFYIINVLDYIIILCYYVTKYYIREGQKW